MKTAYGSDLFPGGTPLFIRFFSIGKKYGVSAEKNTVFIFSRRHCRYSFKSLGEVGQRIEPQKVGNLRKTVVFADKLFAFVDFQFEIVVYYRFAGALAEGFAKSGFAVMQFFRNLIETDFPVNILL